MNCDNLAIKNSIANTNLTFTNKNIMHLKLPMYKKNYFLPFSVNSTDIDDPARPFPKNSIDFKERIKRGAYRPILPLYPCTLQNGRKR